MEHMYVLRKTSVCSVKKVRTFSRKSTDIFEKKYGHFREKVRTFLLKSTDVFSRWSDNFVYH